MDICNYRVASLLKMTGYERKENLKERYEKPDENLKSKVMGRKSLNYIINFIIKPEMEILTFVVIISYYTKILRVVLITF